MDNLISVVIPAYNAEKTIEKCINSISNNEAEIIVVIDGSKDKTSEIVKKSSKENNNIKIIEQENKGSSEARKNGIAHANGKYVMFLDADDCFKKGAIEKMKELIKKYQPDLIRFRYEKIPEGYKQYKYIDKEEEQIFKEEFPARVYPMLLDGYMLNSMCTNCVKREIVNEIEIENSKIKYGEDLIVNLEIFSKIKNVVFTNDVLYEYIFQEDSRTNSKELDKLFKNLEDSIEVYSSLHKYLYKWNMNTLENIEKVNKRIKKESDDIMKIIKKSINS